MLLDNGVKRLGRMAAVESVARNLEMEDRAVERDIAGHEQMLFGMEPSGNGSDEMRITAARDVYVGYDPKQQGGSQQSASQPPEDESLLSKIAKPAAIAAGTMAAGGIGAAAVNALWPDDPPPVVQPAPERPTIELPTVPQAEDGRIRVEVRPYQPEG